MRWFVAATVAAFSLASQAQIPLGLVMAPSSVSMAAGEARAVNFHTSSPAPLGVDFQSSDSAVCTVSGRIPPGGQDANVLIVGLAEGHAQVIYIVHDIARGSFSSTIGSITVTKGAACTPPSVSGKTTSISIARGETVSLAVTVGGTPPIRYRWYSADDPATTLSTSARLTVTPIRDAAYHVVIANDCGSNDFFAAQVTVTAPRCEHPVVLVQPKGLSIASGDDITLTVAASGTQPLQYQWFSDWPMNPTPVSGANSSTLTAHEIRFRQSFWVAVSNGCGSIESDRALVEVSAVRRRAARH
jgi:Ig-like domain-containing protein